MLSRYSALSSGVGIESTCVAADRAALLPVARRQLLLPGGSSARRRRASRSVGTLAVYANRRGDDHLLDLVLRVHQDVEQQRRAARVHVHVPIDLIHALADADRGTEMHDRLASSTSGSKTDRSRTSPLTYFAFGFA